jgi:hypothetical protein
MKLVREHIDEKFTEESDPVHDMGIGFPAIIDVSFEKIFKEDYGKIFTKEKDGSYAPLITNSGVKSIDIRNGHFDFDYFSNRYYDKNGVEVNKLKYAIKLLKHAGIFKCMEKNIIIMPEHRNKGRIEYSEWNIIFKIKPEYIEYFKEKRYFPIDYIKD